MDVYGLTGGIGSGKTTVAELLEDYGVPVVSADELSRIVVARGSDGLADVVSSFGREVLDDQGELDRRKMAAIVFQDPAQRRELEAILHPRIRERFEQVLDALEKAGHEVAVYEVPLLFEKNLQGEMQAVILVTADASIRTRRVQARDDITETEIRARMAAQMDENLKRKRADYIIENNGTMDDLRREVEFLLDRFLRVGSRKAAAETAASSTRMSMFEDDETSNPSRVPTEIPAGTDLPVDGHAPAFATGQIAARGKTLPPLSDNATIGGTTPPPPGPTPTTPAPGPPQGVDSSGAPPSYPSSAPTLPGTQTPSTPTIPSAASISRSSSKTVPAGTPVPAAPSASPTTPVPPPAAPPGASSRTKTAPVPAPPPELQPTLPRSAAGPTTTQPMTPVSQRRTEGVETTPPSERKTVGLSTDPPPDASAVPTPIRDEHTPPRGQSTDTGGPRQGNPDAKAPPPRSRRRKTMPASHFEKLRPRLPGTNRPAPPNPAQPTTPNVPPAPTPAETSNGQKGEPVQPPPPPKPDPVPPPPPPKGDPGD